MNDFGIHSLISAFGLVCLLLIAWLMSYHRGKVKPRPIIWGMSIQFLLGMILFNNNNLSYVGMVLFGGLLVIYILKEVKIAGESVVHNRVLIGLLALVLGVGLTFLGKVAPLDWLLGAVVLGLVVNGFFIKKPGLQSALGALFIITSVALMIAGNMYGKEVFDKFSSAVAAFLKLSDFGAIFMFGNLADEQYFFTGNDSFVGFGFVFAFKVLPTIIFFGGFMSIMYYLGVVQTVILAISRFMRWTMGTSGAETLSCSANIFVGQTEAPLLIKPFLDKMTSSELLTIMVGGFATIAGGVLAGYINMGIDAGHLVTASVMSAPAALVIAKILYPEVEHSATAEMVEMPPIDSGENILEAAASGISDGLKLAMNVGAMLIGFIALIAVLDVTLNFVDRYVDGMLLGGALREYKITGISPVTQEYMGIFPGSLQTLFGTILRPLAWVMGVPWQDAAAVGNLLGVKLSLNEFVAFGSLGTYVNTGVIGERAAVISTYALCGFANFSSIGIQLGGISSLAPERRADLAKVVLKAMFGGALASWTTACIAGIFL